VELVECDELELLNVTDAITEMSCGESFPNAADTLFAI